MIAGNKVWGRQARRCESRTRNRVSSGWKGGRSGWKRRWCKSLPRAGTREFEVEAIPLCDRGIVGVCADEDIEGVAVLERNDVVKAVGNRKVASDPSVVAIGDDIQGAPAELQGHVYGTSELRTGFSDDVSGVDGLAIVGIESQGDALEWMRRNDELKVLVVAVRAAAAPDETYGVFVRSPTGFASSSCSGFGGTAALKAKGLLRIGRDDDSVVVVASVIVVLEPSEARLKEERLRTRER